MICLKLATRTSSFQVEVDATPADCGVANINYERKPLAVPGTQNTGTNYADSRYQLPQIDTAGELTVEQFFEQAPEMNPHRFLITGSICGVKVQEVQDPVMQKIRQLDKLIDELAKGKALEKIKRSDA